MPVPGPRTAFQVRTPLDHCYSQSLPILRVHPLFRNAGSENATGHASAYDDDIILRGGVPFAARGQEGLGKILLLLEIFWRPVARLLLLFFPIYLLGTPPAPLLFLPSQRPAVPSDIPAGNHLWRIWIGNLVLISGLE